VRSTGLTSVQRRSPGSSKQRTRVGIARLASRLTKLRSPGVLPIVLRRQFPKVPLVGVYPSLGIADNLVLRVASI
jgi:hypothetical protein